MKRLTLVVFAVAALVLVWGGQWYQGLILWIVGLLGLILLDKRHVERRLPSILPKLYVCAKPQEYLEWLDDLQKELLFRNLFQEKLDIYRMSGWLYEVNRPHLEGKSPENPLADENKTRDPLKNLEKWLISPSDRYRKQLNAWYHIWVVNGELLKETKPAALKELLEQEREKLPQLDTQETILALISKLIVGKWYLGNQQRQEAERIFSELRETEVFNLMFGEVNYHLGQIEVQKKQQAKALYYYRVAVNFADGTALEAMIPTE